MRQKLLILVLLGLLLVVGLPALAGEDVAVAVPHERLYEKRIYAYRGWQSTGVRVDQGDQLAIRAEGEWLYTPGEYNGPEGHPRYGAPSFYPVPGVPGGALIARIGEEGTPFYVGRQATRHAQAWGTVYLRIDDDILSDNSGWVAVDLQRTPTAASVTD